MKAKPGTVEAAPDRERQEAPEPDTSDIRETDFRGATRNPYLVLLAPDVRRLFPTAEAVNAALREHARDRGLDAE